MSMIEWWMAQRQQSPGAATQATFYAGHITCQLASFVEMLVSVGNLFLQSFGFSSKI